MKYLSLILASLMLLQVNTVYSQMGVSDGKSKIERKAETTEKTEKKVETQEKKQKIREVRRQLTFDEMVKLVEQVSDTFFKRLFSHFEQRMIQNYNRKSFTSEEYILCAIHGAAVLIQGLRSTSANNIYNYIENVDYDKIVDKAMKSIQILWKDVKFDESGKPQSTFTYFVNFSLEAYTHAQSYGYNRITNQPPTGIFEFGTPWGIGFNFDVVSNRIKITPLLDRSALNYLAVTEATVTYAEKGSRTTGATKQRKGTVRSR